MIRRLVILVLVAAGLLGLAAGITVVALEGDEVAVLRTFGPGGDAHEVRVWIVDDGEAVWLEAANPHKEFYLRMLRNPTVELVRGRDAVKYRAIPNTSREARARVRGLLARKYGLADRWIGLLVDTSSSVPIELVLSEEAR